MSATTALLANSRFVCPPPPFCCVVPSALGRLTRPPLQGLPKEWQRLINESGITEKERTQNPEALMQVITFYKETTEKPQEDQILEKFHDARPGLAAAPSVSALPSPGMLPPSYMAVSPMISPPASPRFPQVGHEGSFENPRSPPPVPRGPRPAAGQGHLHDAQPPRPEAARRPPVQGRPPNRPTRPRTRASAWPSRPTTAPPPPTPRRPRIATPPCSRRSTGRDPTRASTGRTRPPRPRPPPTPPTSSSSCTSSRSRPWPRPRRPCRGSWAAPPSKRQPQTQQPTPPQSQHQFARPPDANGGAPRPPQQPQAGGPPPAARPRHRPRQSTGIDVVARLKQICTEGDPRDIYRGFSKIGQGASGGVFTGYEKGSNRLVAIKQMNLEQQPKKDLIINEILVMKDSSHPNIVNFIDSYLCAGELWVVMEFMEGGSLTDVVTFNIMTEGQIASVCRETLKGLQHLHSKGVIHRDIKSDNILLSQEGNIKLSRFFFLSRLGNLFCFYFKCSSTNGCPPFLQPILASVPPSTRRRTSGQPWSALRIGWRPRWLHGRSMAARSTSGRSASWPSR